VNTSQPTPASPQPIAKCTHRVWDQGAYRSRPCGGAVVVWEAPGPRCQSHRQRTAEEKREALKARIARALVRANAQIARRSSPELR
jgi:hypothetical protein